MSYESLHNLDIGIPRFLEFSLTVVIREPIDHDLYAARLRDLLAAWPILQTRMNRLRTKLLASDHDRFGDIWRLKTHKSSLNDVFPNLMGSERPSLFESSSLEDFFRPPTLQKPTRVTMPPVFELRINSFSDGAAIKFTVQHPLCDAAGLYKIVSGYCNLLNNRPLPAARPRAALTVVKEDVSKAAEMNEKPMDLDSFAQSHRDYYSEGWPSFVGKGIKQWANKLRGSSRIERALLIPKSVVDHWRVVAQSCGKQVSRNDLLMAWLYLCTFPDLSAGPTPFAFVLNIESFLEESGDLHNPWCMISVPPLSPTEAANIVQMRRDKAIVAVADHFRTLIKRSRNAGSLSEILKEHEHVNRAPITPREFGTNHPDVRVSSWAHLDLWSLEFPAIAGQNSNQKRVDARSSSAGQDGKSTLAPTGSVVVKPIWVSGKIDFCPAFQWVNLSMNDTMVTWSEDRGYWISGKLQPDVWLRLTQYSTSILSESPSVSA